MRIVNARFVTSVANTKSLIKDKKQIAFVGRSNVGKSSLINMLVDNKKMAKTSSTPGRTRLVNYFLINNDFYFVDLPGYGYAKASKELSSKWQGLIEPYLVDNENLKLVCVLVDIRHEPNEYDIQMLRFLNYYRIPFIVIATKADKLSKSQVKIACDKIAKTLCIGTGNIFATSADTRYGKENVLAKFDQFVPNIED